MQLENCILILKWAFIKKKKKLQNVVVAKQSFGFLETLFLSPNTPNQMDPNCHNIFTRSSNFAMQLDFLFAYL